MKHIHDCVAALLAAFKQADARPILFAAAAFLTIIGWPQASRAENLNQKYGPSWNCSYIDMSLLPLYNKCLVCERRHEDFDQLSDTDGRCIPREGGADDNDGHDDDNGSRQPPPPPPGPPPGEYTVRVCNNGGGGAAWVAHVVYLVPGSEVLWMVGWKRVAENQCIDTVRLPFGNHQSRSFWTYAQFDNGSFWPMQKLDTRLTQFRWCLQHPNVPAQFQDEVSPIENCRGLPVKFFGEREVARNGAANVVATVNIGVNIPFTVSLCNGLASDPMWVLMGLPNNRSPDQPFILSWNEVPAGKCVSRPGYYYADNRREVYYYAESFPKSGGVTVHTRRGDNGPINLCVKPGHQPVNRINTAGYRCAPDERSIGFWRIPLNEDGANTVITLDR